MASKERGQGDPDKEFVRSVQRAVQYDYVAQKLKTLLPFDYSLSSHLDVERQHTRGLYDEPISRVVVMMRLNFCGIPLYANSPAAARLPEIKRDLNPAFHVLAKKYSVDEITVHLWQESR